MNRENSSRVVARLTVVALDSLDRRGESRYNQGTITPRFAREADGAQFLCDGTSDWRTERVRYMQVAEAMSCSILTPDGIVGIVGLNTETRVYRQK